MKLKKRIETNRHKAMLRDLEQMYEKGDISEQTYEEMKQKYEEKLEKLGELEEGLEEEEEKLELELEEMGIEMGELGIRISEKVNEAVAKAMDKVHLAVATLPNSFQSFETGESYVVEDVHEGSFDTDTVLIDVETHNGHIEVKGWDEDTYKIVASKKVRSYSEEKAQERLGKIEVNFEHEKNGTEVLRICPDEHHYVVSITAYLPGKIKGGMLSRDHDITYDLNLDSVNGHIAVADIHVGKAEIDTVNGRIEINRVHADTLDAEASNGRVVLQDCEVETGSVSTENGRLVLTNCYGKTIEGHTDNGSIQGKMSFDHAELQTDAGSIRLTPQGKGEYELETDVGSVALYLDRDVPYHIDAASGMGKVKVASDLAVSLKERRRVVIESESYKDAAERLSIKARTDLGSIKIR